MFNYTVDWSATGSMIGGIGTWFSAIGAIIIANMLYKQNQKTANLQNNQTNLQLKIALHDKRFKIYQDFMKYFNIVKLSISNNDVEYIRDEVFSDFEFSEYYIEITKEIDILKEKLDNPKPMFKTLKEKEYAYERKLVLEIKLENGYLEIYEKIKNLSTSVGFCYPEVIAEHVSIFLDELYKLIDSKTKEKLDLKKIKIIVNDLKKMGVIKKMEDDLRLTHYKFEID